jgi:DNA-binding PadR family transcriptional regulator
MPERITGQLERVLSALVADVHREWYGLELMEYTRLSSGTLYPILHRLVEDGWLVRTREARSDRGGTGRRLYKLTGVGELAARDVLKSRELRRASASARVGRRVRPA